MPASHSAHTYTLTRKETLLDRTGRRREQPSQWIAKVCGMDSPDDARQWSSGDGVQCAHDAITYPNCPSTTSLPALPQASSEHRMKAKSAPRPTVNGYHDKFKWSRREKPEAAVVSAKGARVIFHPKWSNGTAGIRGNKPVNRLRTKCYWEVSGHFGLQHSSNKPLTSGDGEGPRLRDEHDVRHQHPLSATSAQQLHEPHRRGRVGLGPVAQGPHLAQRQVEGVHEALPREPHHRHWLSLQRRRRDADLLQGRRLTGHRLHRSQPSQRQPLPYS